MTDRIDLDELDTETESEEKTPKRGDWFWKGTGDPDEEFQRRSETTADTASAAADSVAENTESETKRQRTPHVPRSNEGKPAGIPVEQGGSGGGAVGDSRNTDNEHVETADNEAASGPHGRGADDMTLAMSYEAAKRLANPEMVFAEASEWADWVGIVGDVDAPVINKFQRDNRLDLDFFNGTGTGPAERLAEVDEFSMFFAERMVFVGVEGEEHVAETADWEFVSLTEATEAAGWEFEEL